MRFVSRVACEFKRDTSKDNRSFVTLPLSSTVEIYKMYFIELLKYVNIQELLHQNHLLRIRILSKYSNSYVTEQISERIEYLFQL